MPKENTKEKLIDAAIVCLQQQGYENTSVAAVVKQAGVAQGTFYLYFKTKYDMVLAIANRILNEQVELCNVLDYKQMSLQAFLREWILIVFFIVKKHQALIGYVMAKSAEKDRYLAWEKAYVDYYQWMATVLEYYQQQDQAVVEDDHMAFVILLVGTVEESAEQYYLYTSNPAPVEKTIDLVHRMIARSVIKRKEENKITW